MMKARVGEVNQSFCIFFLLLSQQLFMSNSLSLSCLILLAHTHTPHTHIHTQEVCRAAELFRMCSVRQIKLGLTDKGPFTHRWMMGVWALQSLSPKPSQSANSPVTKLISQAATQREATSAARCVMFRPAKCDLSYLCDL